MTSKLDQRRLRNGAQAMGLISQETKLSREEIEARMSTLGDAIAAMQSLDDLGSPEANEQAMQDMDKMLTEYKRLKGLLRDK